MRRWKSVRVIPGPGEDFSTTDSGVGNAPDEAAFRTHGGRWTLTTSLITCCRHLTVFNKSIWNRVFSLLLGTLSQRGMTFYDLFWRSRRTRFWLIKEALKERRLGGNLQVLLSVGLSVTLEATCQTYFHQSSHQAGPYGHVRHMSWSHSVLDTQCAKRSTNSFCQGNCWGEKTSNQTTFCTPINTVSADFMPTTSCPALLFNFSLCPHRVYTP